MLLHVITLALGLIIAFGLQQLVALLQRRSSERALQKPAIQAAQETEPEEAETPPRA